MSERAERLVERLRTYGKQTVPLRVVQGAFGEALPHLARDIDSRRHLLQVLQEAEADGALRQNRSRLDTFGSPALPATVVLTRAPETVPRRRRRGMALRPDLEWTNSIPLDDDEAAFVMAVNAFLRDLRPEEPVIPMRERSLEIAGDEKAIQRLVGGRLFGPGRISLAALRCAPTTPPFGYAEVGPAPVLLAVENQDTYWSIRRLLRPEHGVGIVAYGAGNAFTSSVLYVLELPRRIERILYFGDVDAKGLETPIVAGLVAERHDLPPVEPCARLYRLLFALARPTVSEAKSLGATSARHRADWLPADLRSDSTQLLLRGQRLAQEAVGHKALATALGESIQLPD